MLTTHRLLNGHSFCFVISFFSKPGRLLCMDFCLRFTTSNETEKKRSFTIVFYTHENKCIHTTLEWIVLSRNKNLKQMLHIFFVVYKRKELMWFSVVGFFFLFFLNLCHLDILFAPVNNVNKILCIEWKMTHNCKIIWFFEPKRYNIIIKGECMDLYEKKILYWNWNHVLRP